MKDFSSAQTTKYGLSGFQQALDFFRQRCDEQNNKEYFLNHTKYNKQVIRKFSIGSISHQELNSSQNKPCDEKVNKFDKIADVDTREKASLQDKTTQTETSNVAKDLAVEKGCNNQ